MAASRFPLTQGGFSNCKHVGTRLQTKKNHKNITNLCGHWQDNQWMFAKVHHELTNEQVRRIDQYWQSILKELIRVLFTGCFTILSGFEKATIFLF